MAGGRREYDVLRQKRSPKSKGLVSLGNEGGEASFELAGFGNSGELSDDGWTLMPFGEWPHSEGIQRFGAEQAQRIVDNFKKGWGRFKRAIVGLPVYRGHPDVAAFANEYKDKTEYGQVADMEVRADGLAIKSILSEAGAKLVTRGLKYISPHWLANAAGKKGSITIYEPVFIKSIGLVDRPNIPNKSLINSAEAGKYMNKEFLLKLLALANAATDAEIEAALTALAGRPTAQALANAQAAQQTAEAKAVKAEGELATVKTERDAHATSLANARSANIGSLIASALKAGKITEGEKALWVKRLEQNFEVESVALGNAQAMKTTPTAEQLRLAAADAKLKKDLANEGGDDDESDATPIANLVNAEMESAACKGIANRGERYNRAFANVKRKFPARFEPLLPKNG